VKFNYKVTAMKGGHFFTTAEGITAIEKAQGGWTDYIDIETDGADTGRRVKINTLVLFTIERTNL
jgi:hypothetical protein